MGDRRTIMAVDIPTKAVDNTNAYGTLVPFGRPETARSGHVFAVIFATVFVLINGLAAAILWTLDPNQFRLGFLSSAAFLYAAIGLIASLVVAFGLSRYLASAERRLNPDARHALREEFAAMLDHDREQLRAILSGMVEGVIAIDDNRCLVFANDRAGMLLGFSPASAVGSRLGELRLPHEFLDMVDRALSGSGPHREELDWKGPPPRTLAVYISRFPGHGMPGSVVVLHDTTDLRQVERMRQDFVANVSHELKTPLAVIKSSVEALTDGAVDEPEARSMFLSQVTREADRLEELIQDLLSLARIESGNLGLEPQAIALDRAITDCVERHQPRAEVKTLTMVERPPVNVPANVAAWVDPDALRQVMDNLVDNAIKYTANGGRITVRWGAAADSVNFEVADTGAGIPEADLPRIFERFYRVDKARSRAVGGTGLGLAIVKHLVQAMKGQVKVTSEVGKGTTFRVTLPRAA